MPVGMSRGSCFAIVTKSSVSKSENECSNVLVTSGGMSINRVLPPSNFFRSFLLYNALNLSAMRSTSTVEKSTLRTINGDGCNFVRSGLAAPGV